MVDTESQAQAPFTINVRNSAAPAGTDNIIQYYNSSYNDILGALEAAQTAGATATIPFTKEIGTKIVGVPAFTITNAEVFSHAPDQYAIITIIGDTEILGQQAQVLIHARWSDTTIVYDPQIAVVFRIESTDLGVLNSSWSEVPVGLESVLIGLANEEHTLFPDSLLGTEDFFSGGPTGSENLIVRPTGVALQAVLSDGPLEEGASVLGDVDQILIRGTLGTSESVLGPDGAEKDTKGLNLIAQVTADTPEALADAGIGLDTDWKLEIKANTGGTYFASFTGKATVTLDELGDADGVEFSAALAVNYTSGPPSTVKFTLTGTVGDVDDLFDQEWLDLKQLQAAITLEKTATGLNVGGWVSATLTLNDGETNEVDLTAKIAITRSSSSGATPTPTETETSTASPTAIPTGTPTPTGPSTTVAITLELVAAEDSGIPIADILEGIGAPTADEGDALREVNLTNLGLLVQAKTNSAGTTLAVAATGGAKILARPGCTAGDPAFAGADAEMLFRMEVGGAQTTFFIGARLSGLTLKQIDCNIPFEWTLPTVAITAGSQAIDSPWLTLDTPTKAFFDEIYCTPTCPVRFQFDAGVNLIASVSLGDDLEDMFAELNIDVSGNLLIRGTLPILGGDKLLLNVRLPDIESTDPDSIVSGGAVGLELSVNPATASVEAKVTGVMDFRIARADAQCTADPLDPDSLVAPAGYFTQGGGCYDELTLGVELAIEVSPTTGVKLSLSGFITEWQNAFGEPNLTIQTFVLEISVQVGPTGPVLGVGMRGSLLIGENDLTIAFLVEIGVSPPRILLKGLTVGTAKGVSIQDIVATFAPDLEADEIPPAISLKNIWFAYGTETNVALCIRQGFYLSAELHLNDPDPANSAGTNPICGTTVPNSDDPRFCTPNESSCLAAILVDIGPKRFKLYGAISGFELGPVDFDGLELLIDISLTKQQIFFEGAATLLDPVDYYIPPEGTDNVWASGYLSIDVSQNAGVFSASLEGCALLGGTAKASPECPVTSTTVLQAYVYGSVTINFTKVGLEAFEEAEFDFELSAPALEELLEDIEEELGPVIDWVEDAADTVEGTVTEVVLTVENGWCVTWNLDCGDLTVTADAYSDAPAYIDAKINETDVRIRDSAAVNLYCFATFQWPVKDCVQGYRDTARTANEARIAQYGGRQRIALHGISNVTGFGGIYDSDFPDVEYIPPTVFNWPGAGQTAPCATGGVLAGTSICGAAGVPDNVNDLVGPILAERLGQIDPSLAEYLLERAGATTQTQTLGEAQILAQTTVDGDKIVQDIKTLASIFDSNKPSSICQATIPFSTKDTGTPLTMSVKTDAQGGKTIVNTAVSTTPETGGSLNVKSIQEAIFKQLLENGSTSDLDCPTGPPTPPAETLTMSLSATSINEGDSVVLTGTAPAGATVVISWGEEGQTSNATATAAGTWTATYTYKDGPATRLIDATTGTAPNIARKQAFITVSNLAPASLSVTPPGVLNEGDSFTLTGTFADAGVRDGHTVNVSWGDGNTDSQSIAAGAAKSISLQHIYRDEGSYSVSLTVRDKDGATALWQDTIEVLNVAPYEVQLVSTEVDGEVTPRTGSEPLEVLEGTTVTYHGTFRDPGLDDTHVVLVDFGESNATIEDATGGILNPNLIGLVFAETERDANDPELVHFTATYTFADDQPSVTPSDLMDIRIAADDGDGGVGEATDSVRVNNVAPVLTTNGGEFDVQYSDPIGGITLTARDVVGYVDGATWSETLSASTRWNVDGGDFQDGLPANLSFAFDSCESMDDPIAATTQQECEWTVSGIADVAPGTYIIEFTVVDDDTGTTTTTVELEVEPEDAEARYVGPSVASSPQLHSGPMTLELRAVVRDISQIAGHPLHDEYPGDIANATVAFLDADTGAVLCSDDDIDYVFAGNTGVAVAVCDAELPAGTYEVEVVVGGWYTNERSTAENPTIVIQRPSGSFVTGGGFINTAGTPAEMSPSGRTDVNLNARWGMPRFSSLTGSSRLRFDAGGKSYEVDITSYDSLGVMAVPGADGIGHIEARANLVDRSRGRGTVVESGLRLQIQVTDIGGKADVGFALWRDDGTLIVASGWDGDFFPEVPHAGGNSETHIK